MDESPPTVGEDLARALAMALIRKGVLDADDISYAAEIAADGTPRGDAVAHLLGCAIVEASQRPVAQEEADFRAAFMRRQMRARTAMIAARLAAETPQDG